MPGAVADGSVLDEVEEREVDRGGGGKSIFWGTEVKDGPDEGVVER